VIRQSEAGRKPRSSTITTHPDGTFIGSTLGGQLGRPAEGAGVDG